MTSTFLKLPFGPEVAVVPFDTRVHADVKSGVRVPELRLAARHVASFSGFLRNARPDLVVLFTGYTRSFWRDLLLINIAARLRLPIVLRLYGGRFPLWLNSLHGLPRRAAYSGLRRVCGITVETSEQVDQFKSILPTTPAFQFSNFVDRRDFPTLGGRGTMSEGGVVYFGTMTPTKGVETVLRSVDMVCARIPIDFHFVGGEAEAGYLDSFRAMAAQCSFAARIHVHGQKARTDAHNIAGQCRVFAFPTQFAGEGQPAALLEAMSLGLVPVSSPWRGVKDIIRHEENGLFVNSGDAPALAESICTLLADDALRSRLAENARATVMRDFESSAILRRFYQILAEICVDSKGL